MFYIAAARSRGAGVISREQGGVAMENVPVVIGRYRLSKTLGIGAFGKVKCRCKNKETVN